MHCQRVEFSADRPTAVTVRLIARVVCLCVCARVVYVSPLSAQRGRVVFGAKVTADDGYFASDSRLDLLVLIDLSGWKNSRHYPAASLPEEAATKKNDGEPAKRRVHVGAKRRLLAGNDPFPRGNAACKPVKQCVASRRRDPRWTGCCGQVE